MKRISRLFLLLAAALCLPAAGAAFTPEAFTGKVVNVKDGDSLQVLRDRRVVEVRLNGVDAPERSQAFGTRARKFTLAACIDRVVTVTAVGIDKYGRTLGEVSFADGTSFNQEIVRAGYAWWFRRYSGDETLKRLEEEARAARRGLWADKAPVPPWEFRHREASPGR